MSSTSRKSLASAKRNAHQLTDLFSTSDFKQWFVAGSIRREQPYVGDIDHVVVTTTGAYLLPQADLFTAETTGDLFLAKLDDLLRNNEIQKALHNGIPRWGNRHRSLNYAGFTHEFYIATPTNFGSVLAIRTGPSGFSQFLVSMLRKNQMCNRFGNVYDLKNWSCPCGETKPPEWHSISPETIKNKVWIENKGPNQTEFMACCKNCQSTDIRPKRVEVPTERDFFRCCGLDYVEPSNRQ